MDESLIQISPAIGSSGPSALFNWGIGVIKVIQSISNPPLTAVMKVITSLGTEYFYLALILLIFWCVDEKKGFRLGLLIISSAWINLYLKLIFNQPRPYELEPSLALAHESSRAFPSGHAQVSFAFWIALVVYLAGKRKSKPLIWLGPVFIILLIGFTRLYLGVHFPTDVFGGWIIGAFVLLLFLVLEKPLSNIFTRAGRRLQFIFPAAMALLMNALNPADTSLSALLLGFSVGYSLMQKSFPFSARGEIAQLNQRTGQKPGIPKLAPRIALGFIGTALIYQGLKLILPGNNSLFTGIPVLEGFYELGRFIRYGLLGFWASAGAPWVFLHLGLAGSGDTGHQEES